MSKGINTYMTNIIKYLKSGLVPAIVINTIWHITSLTPCKTWERIAGWSFVWLFITAIIWTCSSIMTKFRKTEIYSIIKNDLANTL